MVRAAGLKFSYTYYYRLSLLTIYPDLPSYILSVHHSYQYEQGTSTSIGTGRLPALSRGSHLEGRTLLMHPYLLSRQS